jgi:uncharacterized membrane protein YesL
MSVTQLLRQAFGVWWRNAVHIAFFNALWLVLQLLVVTGPPATAAVYLVTSALLDGEHVTPRDLWVHTKRMFVPAWKWGLLNLLIVGAVVVNFWISREQPGDVWAALRIFWAAVGVIWLAISLLYWPLWMAEEDQSMRNTLRNGLVLLMHSPGLVLWTLVISAISLAFSIVAVIPVVNFIMGWIASLGLITTRHIVAQLNAAAQSANEPDTIDEQA